VMLWAGRFSLRKVRILLVTASEPEIGDNRAASTIVDVDSKIDVSIVSQTTHSKEGSTPFSRVPYCVDDVFWR
jgi:hypothetical protein